MSEKDPVFHIRRLFIDYKSFLNDQGWNDLLKRNISHALRHICMLLKPEGLRRRVQDVNMLGKCILKKDCNHFYMIVLAEAIVYDKSSSKELSGDSPRSCVPSVSEAVNINCTYKEKVREEQNHHDGYASSSTSFKSCYKWITMLVICLLV